MDAENAISAQGRTSTAPKYAGKMLLRLGRRRESSGKWVCFQTAAHFFISPGFEPASLKRAMPMTPTLWVLWYFSAA